MSVLYAHRSGREEGTAQLGYPGVGEAAEEIAGPWGWRLEGSAILYQEIRVGFFNKIIGFGERVEVRE